MPLFMGMLPLIKPTRIIRVSLKRQMRARSGEADSHTPSWGEGGGKRGEGGGKRGEGRQNQARRSRTRTRTPEARTHALSYMTAEIKRSDPARPDTREKTRKDAASATDEGGGEAGVSGGSEWGWAGEEGRWWGERGGREVCGREGGGPRGGAEGVERGGRDRRARKGDIGARKERERGGGGCGNGYQKNLLTIFYNHLNYHKIMIRCPVGWRRSAGIPAADADPSQSPSDSASASKRLG